ncbi:MAG: SGNH/GDSL hydrolase family protein [Verrucomicrobia bacterium]|nr:SGNH/GDSL hydrolase family protein [Verrucomicrobiota bacterium]
MKLRLPIGFVLASAFIAAGFAADKAPKKEKAPDPSLASVAEVSGLPRVLLIGDSISMGYTLPVRAKLAGKANVHRPAENCGDTARGVKSLDQWLGGGKWDVIHFNFGLHDLKYLDEKGAYVTPDKGRQVATPADYEKNLRTVVARLKQTGARLIFATTTPVPSGSAGRVEHDELRYNDVAVRAMKELGVALDDLHAVVVRQQDKIQRPRNVHFTDPGYAVLADQVVAAILPALPAGAK